MINETLRRATAWLQDATYGVNAQLAAVPRDAGDAQPANVVVFADEASHEDAALGRSPETVPAIVVTVESARMINDQVVHEVGDGEVVLNLRLYVADVDAKDAKRDASYYLRALSWCVRKWVAQSPGGSARTKNSVQIVEIGAMEFNALYESKDDRIVAGGARLALTVRDVGLA